MCWKLSRFGLSLTAMACVVLQTGCGGQPGGPPLPDGAVSIPPAPEPRAFTEPLPEPTAPLNQELVTNGGFEEWVPPLPYLWHTGSEDYIEAFRDARTGALAVLLKPSPRGEITVTQYLPLKKTAADKRLTAEAFARSTAPNEAFIEVMFTTAAGVQKNRRWYAPVSYTHLTLPTN